MSRSTELRTNIKADELGRIDTANDQNRLLNAHVWMPPPEVTPQDNLDNFAVAYARAVKNGMGGTILWQPGVYRFPDTVVVRDVQGLRLIGAGGATQIVSTFNDATKPVLVFAHARQCHTEGFQISAEGAAYAGIQLRRDDLTSANIVPTHNHFSDLFINCRNRMDGVVLGGTGSVDANNDFNRFEQMEITDYQTRGVDLRGASQSYNNVLANCLLRAGSNGQYGVDATGDFAGHFLWRDGGVFSNQAADFGIGQSYAPYVIDGGNSEGSKRFLVMNSGSFGAVLVQNFRWAKNGIHDDLTPIIVRGGRGRFSMEGCDIGDSSGDKAVKLDFQNTRVGMRFNNVYSNAATVFTHDTPLELVGNTKTTNEGTQTRVDLLA